MTKTNYIVPLSRHHMFQIFSSFTFEHLELPIASSPHHDFPSPGDAASPDAPGNDAARRVALRRFWTIAEAGVWRWKGWQEPLGNQAGKLVQYACVP